MGTSRANRLAIAHVTAHDASTWACVGELTMYGR